MVTIYNPKGLADISGMTSISLKGLDGIICIHALPDFLDPDDSGGPEYDKWRASITQAEYDRYLLPVMVDGREQDYAHNLLTTDGITTILKNISFAAQASLEPFAQILSVGNGTIAAVARADTAVAGDAFGTNARQTPNGSPVITGNQVDIATSFASGDAVGLWTNIGFYGFRYSNSTNATSTAGSGTLKTHSLFSFNKGGAIVCDYIFVLNN